MNRPERILLIAILALVFLGALVALTVVYREELRQVLVIPLQGIWLNFMRAWLGLGADFRWSMFILILSVLLFISIPSSQASWQQPVLSSQESNSGRLVFWMSELKGLLEQDTLSRLSILELRGLALEVVGYRQKMSIIEANAWLLERLEAGDTHIPPAMRLLVDPAALGPSAYPAFGSLDLGDFFRFLFGISKEGPARVPVMTAGKLEAIIHYLEQVLEGTHEHDNR